MWTKESLFSASVFVGSNRWTTEDFDRSSNELKAIMVVGLMQFTNISRINAWIARGKIARDVYDIVRRIVAEGLVECPGKVEFGSFSVSSAVLTAAREWLNYKYATTDPSSWINNDRLDCRRELNPDLLNDIFYTMQEWTKTILWLTTLPKDPSITIAAAKAVSPDRAESARKAFILAAQMNCINHPINNNTILLETDSLIALRKWYCCQPESIVKLSNNAPLQCSPGSSSSLSLFKGDEVRIISGPHGTDSGRSWFRCIVKKTAGLVKIDSSGFLLIDNSDLQHDVGLKCSDSLMDGQIIHSQEEYEEENKLSSINLSEETLRKSSISTYIGTGGMIFQYSPGTINELELAMEALREQIELKNASIKKLTEDLEAAKSCLNSANTALDTERSTVLEVSKRLEDLDKKFCYDVKCTESMIREKQQEINKVHKTMSELRKSHAADVKTYEDRLSGKQELIDDVYKKLTEISDRNEELSDKLVKLSESLDYELGRTSELEVLLEEKNKSSETMSSTIFALSGISSEAVDVAYRTATSQLVKLARAPISSGHSHIHEMLNTDIGCAMISAFLSIGMMALPENEHTERLSRELRVKSAVDASDAILDLIAGPIRRIISDYASSEADFVNALKCLPESNKIDTFSVDRNVPIGNNINK